MTQGEASLEQKIEALRRENTALEEQVKLLVRTEHRLSIYQSTVQRQLERIEGAVRMFADFDIREDEVGVLAKLVEFMEEHFLVHACATLEAEIERREIQYVPRASQGLRVKTPSTRVNNNLDQRLGQVLAPIQDVTVVIESASTTMSSITSFFQAMDPVLPLSPDGGDRYVIVPIRPSAGSKHWFLILATFAKGRMSHYVAAPSESDASFFSLVARHMARLINDRRQTNSLRRERIKLSESNDALQRSLEELRQTQERLVRSTKLEAVGRLSAGVAHDFNNLLTLILGYGAELRHEFSNGTRQRGDVDAILEAGNRAAELTRQLLVFGRGRRVRTQHVNLNQVVEDMLNMLRRLLSEDIEFQCDLSSGELPIIADPSELEQVVMNLVINAQDAMPRGGRLVVSTRRTMALIPTEPGGPKPDASVPCAVLSVSDTGMGMDEKTRGRVFEPFFTTKEVGEGTGMGLAIVYGVVSDIGGAIDVHSRVGSGTRFDVQIPLCERSSSATDGQRTSSEAHMHGARIVVLEDEPGIRRLCERILSARGFEVILCDSPNQVMDAVTNTSRPAELLLLDVVMPGTCGPEVAKAVRRTHPHLPILFMSGHTRSKLDAHEFDGDRHQLIRKPFAPAKLIDAVQDALGASRIASTTREPQ